MTYQFAAELAGRTIVITGGGRSIGREMATAATAAKMKVAILEVNKENLDKTVAELKQQGGDVTGYVVDLQVESQIIDAFAKIEKDFGKIEVLVNNAAFHDSAELLDSSLEMWNKTFAINTAAPFLCIRAVLPGMIARKSGSIINIGTVNSKMMIGSDSYTASKAALHALTRTVAVRYGKHNIRCNTVVPGTIATEVWQERIDRNPAVFEQLKSWYPLGRVGKPSDITAAVLYLASDQAPWMTGTEFLFDGGLLAGFAPMYPVVEGSD
ncbi:MAG: SDR family NAD(P)-dependent oxidoreductase [Candidatus Nanopelagicaceae bacterium]